MPQQQRILFISNYPNQPIGFSKISNILSNALADMEGTTLYYFGFFNNVRPSVAERYVNPKIRFIDVYAEETKRGFDDFFGVNIICEYIELVDPHWIVIYNECIVTSRLFNHINAKYKTRAARTFKVLTYLDLVYDFQCPEYLQFVYDNSDKLLLFSDHWYKNLRATLRRNTFNYEDKVGVMYHGFNTAIYKKLDKAECRKYFNIDEDAFVILNANRNSYRKTWDITIGAFLAFLKAHDYDPRLKLFVHCSLETKDGYTIPRVIEIMGKVIGIPTSIMNEKVVKNNFLVANVAGVDKALLSDETMNMLYNACDVGINTCLGEGYGLCSMEHAVLGKPQIVSKVGGLEDIFGDEAIEPTLFIQIPPNIEEHTGMGGILSIKDVVDKLEDIYARYDYYADLYENKISKDLLIKYNWEAILKKFLKEFQ